MITDLYFREWLKSIDDFKNWDSIQEALLKNVYLNTQFHKPNYGSAKGYIFEHLIKYVYSYSNNKVYLYKDIPHKLKQQLNLPTMDKGIDLIVKINDEWVGIQCKWRSLVNNSLLKHFVTDFIYSINNSKLAYGIMCTNVHKITPGFNKIDKLKWLLYHDLCSLITTKLVKHIKRIEISNNIIADNNIELKRLSKRSC